MKYSLRLLSEYQSNWRELQKFIPFQIYKAESNSKKWYRLFDFHYSNRTGLFDQILQYFNKLTNKQYNTHKNTPDRCGLVARGIREAWVGGWGCQGGMGWWLEVHTHTHRHPIHKHTYTHRYINNITIHTIHAYITLYYITYKHA